MNSIHKLLRCLTLSISFIPVLVTTISSVAADQGEGSKEPHIQWREWNERVFADAAKEKKLVILDLQAIWCHWCHVMEEQTYSQADIIKTITTSYIPVQADQDAHPDLSALYRDYGWPATVLFNSKGEVLKIMTGFVEPDEMRAALKESVANPKPQSNSRPNAAPIAVLSSLPAAVREDLQGRHERSMDLEVGGLKTSHRYLDPGSIEYALLQARDGSKQDIEWAKKTLTANLKLIDPVWGGVYQYSTNRDWDHPHFERILSTQSANISLYSLGYKVFRDPAYLDAAERIAKYVNSFLRSSAGVYYVSQDADVKQGEHAAEYYTLDDAKRRAVGIPKIDSHEYARENGWAIEGMCDLYAASNKREYLDSAATAAQWILQNRARAGGGFNHGPGEQATPFLGDSLYAGRGFLCLYSVTGERKWLEAARQALDFIVTEFRDAQGVGFFSTSPKKAGILKPIRRLEENAPLARFANSLFRYSGEAKYQTTAREALTFISQKEVALDSISEPIVLTVDTELSNEPPHFTVLGSKSATEAAQLWAATLAFPASYLRREWWDRAEGPMPNPDVNYPNLPRPAAFVCANKRCSLPMFTVAELETKLKETQAAAAKRPETTPAAPKAE